MTFDPLKHKRRSIRLIAFDYSKPNAYYVTVCVQDRISLFGGVYNNEMILNSAGKMVEEYWQKLSEKYESVELGKYIIMPNHIHGIINIVDVVGAGLCACPPNLSKMMQWFKSFTTTQYLKNVKSCVYQPVNKRLWQRNYYEHIIRNEKELSAVNDYIINNPYKWLQDEYFNA